jgi:tetratricopeptide (TPR) repeat protein
LILAVLLQVGPNPLAGGMAGDDLVRDRPAREVVRPDAVQAELNASSAWLETCLAQLADDPARAHATAQIRRTETKGTDRVLANHCLGMASSELGLWQDARAAFIAARDETPAGEARTRARFGALAGNAALAGGDGAGALDLLSRAEADARAAGSGPLAAVAATDRARALVGLGQEAEALAALEAATTLAPELSEGWVLKATLLRRLDRLGEAQTAIERAASLAPMNPAIGLEAGVIAILASRDDAARQSWQSVIDLAPESTAAGVARGYLAQLAPAGDTASPQEETPQP